MRREHNETFDRQNWVPWIGLALVLPAVIVLLVGALGIVSSTGRAPNGRIVFGEGPSIPGIAGGVVAAIGAFGGLILALVGIVRGLRRPAPHNGRSVGIAGFTLEIGVIIIAAAALALLGINFL